MDNLFLMVLNMSITGAFVIAAICLARIPLRKAPKIISYCLWAVAAFRLACPLSLESLFSLIPFNARPIPADIAMQRIPRIDSGIAIIDNVISGSLPAASQVASVNPLQIWQFLGCRVWLIGLASMVLYGVLSYIVLKKKMQSATFIEANICEAENIRSPFVLGILKPKIYLPVGLTEQERDYILLHEQTHIRRHDHLVKFAAYFIVCVHWFNPLAWVAFLLMGVDMEMSCDERVLKEMGGAAKKDYSLSLLSMATEKRIIGGSPLAFSEGGLKARIKNVLKFKKPSRVIVISAAALAAVLTVGFAVNGVQDTLPWANVPQKSNWPASDIAFDRITFGSDRDMVVYRMGREPDSQTTLTDGSVMLYYYLPPTMYSAPGESDAAPLPGTDIHVTFYLDSAACRSVKNLFGVWRIDVEGSCDMVGRDTDGTLSDVLAQYGGPNAVDSDGNSHTLWYYSPEDTDLRLWFEVEGEELTGRMGITCVYGTGGSDIFSGKNMTLDDVRTLAAKGDDLHFSDFSGFLGADASSNLNYRFMVYNVEGGYRLIVRSSPYGKPDGISLESIWGSGGSGIDIRYDSVDDFILANPSHPAITADEALVIAQKYAGADVTPIDTDWWEYADEFPHDSTNPYKKALGESLNSVGEACQLFIADDGRIIAIGRNSGEAYLYNDGAWIASFQVTHDTAPYSSKFSQKEIDAAMDCVRAAFSSFKGCQLEQLWYDEEKSDKNAASDMTNGRGATNGVEEENVIVLLSNFSVDSSGGDGSLNPNSMYTNWMWILIRDSKTGKWRVDDRGY